MNEIARGLACQFFINLTGYWEHFIVAPIKRDSFNEHVRSFRSSSKIENEYVINDDVVCAQA